MSSLGLANHIVQDVGSGHTKDENLTTCAGGNSSLCKDSYDKDSEIRNRFEQRVASVMKDLLAVEIETFVQNVSGSALTALAKELLSFTVSGEQYLCLNVTGEG
ncbi:unnamed protein product [Discula destructiva]